MTETLERFFHLRQRKSTVAAELRGAIATFLTMAYIIPVNAGILADAGVPHAPALAATALAAGSAAFSWG